MLDPSKRPTADELLKHPFLSMSEKEIKESLEASNFISFFSILASHKSLPGEGKYHSITPLEDRDEQDFPIGDTGGNHDLGFYPQKYKPSESMSSLPNIEIRVSKVIMDRLLDSKMYNSIVSNGSI